MEAGFIALVIVMIGLGIVAGIVLGFYLGRSIKKSRGTQGTIYAYYDSTNADPSLLLEYSVPINDIASRKQVTFNVQVIK